jgi:hypothetical protein
VYSPVPSYSWLSWRAEDTNRCHLSLTLVSHNWLKLYLSYDIVRNKDMHVEDDVSIVIAANDVLFTNDIDIMCTIPVGDGHVGANDSDDDDKPIAATLHAQPKAGSAEVQAKKRKKKQKRHYGATS